MAVIRCPTCNNLFDSEKTTAMPFCGERCQKVDLRRWLSEQYGFPVESDHELEIEQEPPDCDRS